MNDQPVDDAMLRTLAQQLGVRAAERVDPERTAQAVVRRLRDPHPARSRWRQPLSLAAAATIMLLLGAGVVWRGGRPDRPASNTALGQTSLDLSDLSADQLRDVLNAVDEPLDVEPTAATEPGLDDLTPGELRTLLRALEG